MPASSIACPIAHCGAAKHPAHLMCLAHWRMVPKALRHKLVSRPAQRRSGVPMPHAMQLHRQACDAAIAAVEAKLLQRQARREASAGAALDLDALD